MDEKISIIIPCRNEETCISSCIESVLAFDFPKESLEVLLIDGMSTDDTPEIIRAYCKKHPFIRILQNPARIVAPALNIGIRNARGGIIVRLDAHSYYPPDYIKRCVELLKATGAANAGGRFVNVKSGDGIWAEAIQFATGHLFGVGAGVFRIGTKAAFVDTVPYGTFRRDIFDKVGMFDERLTRTEDNEFNDRLREAGYKIAFDPEIKVFYRNQSTLRGLVRQGFYTAMWNVYTLKLFPYTFKLRRFIPVLFSLYLTTVLFLYLFARHEPILYLLPLVIYIVSNLAISLSRKTNYTTKLAIAVTFFVYHLSYGLGTCFGLFNLFFGLWRNYLGKPLPITADSPKSLQSACRPEKTVDFFNSKVSVIIPCRNEEKYIVSCLDSLLAFEFPKQSMEVVIVDGMSTDSTREIVRVYCEKYPYINLLDNPGQIVPSAMNIGIKAAVGEFIVRLDAHAEYPRTYIKDCLQLLLKTGAENAGGRFVTVPNGSGPWAVPVSVVTAHRFGVGTGMFRVGRKADFVQTVPYGTFHKEIFSKVGLFDERLTRNQDNEFNDRLCGAGYKIAFDPTIEIYYKNQATLKGLIRQGFYTSMWNVYTLILCPYTFKWRRFVPAAFAIYILLAPLILFFTSFDRAYFSVFLIYLVLNLAVSLTRGYAFSVRVRIAVTFISYHLAYGFGAILGVFNVTTGKWKTQLGKPLSTSVG